MNRRDFLSHSLVSAAGVMVLPSLLPGCTTAHDPLHDFGMITNVVQNLMKEDHRDYFKKYPGRFELVHIKDSYESLIQGGGLVQAPDRGARQTTA